MLIKEISNIWCIKKRKHFLCQHNSFNSFRILSIGHQEIANYCISQSYTYFPYSYQRAWKAYICCTIQSGNKLLPKKLSWSKKMWRNAINWTCTQADGCWGIYVNYVAAQMPKLHRCWWQNVPERNWLVGCKNQNLIDNFKEAVHTLSSIAESKSKYVMYVKFLPLMI